MTVPANRYAKRVETAGAGFIAVALGLHESPAFNGMTQQLESSRLFAGRVVSAARCLGMYEELLRPSGMPQALRDMPELAMTDSVNDTRAAIAPAIEELLASDEFAIGELDFDQLKALSAALRKFGIPLERLEDKIAGAERALRGSRHRFMDGA